MRLFLFSASVFYILGLKLTSKIEIKPFFQEKHTATETSASPAEKPEVLKLETKPSLSKKYPLHHTGTKISPATAPTVKDTEK